MSGPVRCPAGCRTYLYDNDIRCPKCGAPRHVPAAAPPMPPSSAPEPGPIPWRNTTAFRLSLTVALVAAFFGGRYVLQQAGIIADGAIVVPALEIDLQQAIEKRTGIDVVVSCPFEIPKKKNKIVECGVRRTDREGASSNMFVTIVDLDGHFRFEIEDPQVLVVLSP